MLRSLDALVAHNAITAARKDEIIGAKLHLVGGATC